MVARPAFYWLSHPRLQLMTHIFCWDKSNFWCLPRKHTWPACPARAGGNTACQGDAIGPSWHFTAAPSPSSQCALPPPQHSLQFHLKERDTSASLPSEPLWLGRAIQPLSNIPWENHEDADLDSAAWGRARGSASSACWMLLPQRTTLGTAKL